MSVSYSRQEVEEWDLENVVAYLKVLDVSEAVIEAFHENDINGAVLVDLNEELVAEMNLSPEDATKLLEGIKQLSTEGSTGAEAYVSEDDEDDGDDADASPAASASAPAPALATSTGPTPTMTLDAAKRSKARVDKKNDPLRVAARTKAVADLANSAVTMGWLYKTGSANFVKNWKKRYFVLTDDNCLYYFKGPKDMSALGMILLPSYTVTRATKTESNRPWAFKVFNRQQSGARTYLFAADDERDMKTWMNVMSLASIAFGTGRASMQKNTSQPQALTQENDSELELMQHRAQARAGGVAGDRLDNPLNKVSMPDFVKRTKATRSSKSGPALVLVKLLDGETLQLYAEPSTTGDDFLNQICTMLKMFEKYYFGLMYYDQKNEMVWVDLKKKFLKQDIPRPADADHYELEFRIRFFPVDVTHVLQYVTLYQTFLSSRQSVIKGELEITNKDAFTLASLALQAVLGDYDETKHTPEFMAKEQLIPEANKDDIIRTSNINVANMQTFWAEEVIRVWKTLRGILRHLAVLKYMQVVQKHPQFAMLRYDIKNKNGTPLVLGVSPRGLYVFRLNNMQKPVVTFSWAECSELAFADKKFTICVHDKATKDFSVFFNRAKTCQRILDMCVGYHSLYVQTVHNWENPPPEHRAMRQQAIQAALDEREQLKKEAIAARERARASRPEAAAQDKASAPSAAVAAPSVAPPTQPPPSGPPAGAAPADSKEEDKDEVLETDEGEQVYIKGRAEAVAMLDMMMNDPDFMRFQEDIMNDFDNSMMEELEQGGRLRSASFAGGKRKPQRRAEEEEDVEVCSSEELQERVSYLQDMNVV